MAFQSKIAVCRKAAGKTVLALSLLLILSTALSVRAQPWSGIVSAAPRNRLEHSGSGRRHCGADDRLSDAGARRPCRPDQRGHCRVPRRAGGAADRRDIQFVKRHRDEKQRHAARRRRGQDVSGLLPGPTPASAVGAWFALPPRTTSGAATPTPCRADRTPHCGRRGSRRGRPRSP